MFQNHTLQIAIIVFFITVIASRFMLMNALKTLSDEDKAKLLSSNMINRSQTQLLIVIAVLGIYYFAIIKYPQYATALMEGFAVIIICNRIITFLNTQKKLHQMQLPETYIKTFITSSVVYNVGLVVFFLLLIKDYI